MTTAPPPDAVPPAPPRQRGRILIAEDEGLLAEELRDLLEASGHEVLDVVDLGEEAVRSAERLAPDLLLLDIRLKGRVDGIDAATQIGERLGTPFVYLTAHSDDVTLRRAKRTGPLGYLIKPVRERELLVTVEMALYRADLERRLRESEARYETTLNSIGDAVIAADADGRVTFLNPVAEVLTQWPRAEAIGRPLDQVFRLVDADTREPRPSPVRRAVEENRIVNLPAHTLLIGRNGGEVAVDDSAAPIRDALRGGGGVVVFRDVTEAVRAQQTARKAEEERRQSQKMESLGRLAGGLAHDINNMMTTVIGYGEIALRQLAADHPVWGMVEEMKRAGDRAATLMRQLLAFSRKQVTVPTALDVNDVVTGMLGMLDRLIGAEVSLQTHLQPGSLSVTADRGQLEQVVMNLVVNARDAMPHGGVLTLQTALAHRADGSPDVPAGEYAVLTVADTGFGMDAVTRTRVFEPFFTTKDPGRGTGLGLATVYGIVKQAGGHIAVESELGRGTTFKISWPVSAEARPGPPARPETGPRGGSETILLVDDDEGVRRMTRVLLRHLGYRVIEAAEGREALLACESEPGPIDLLLTDAIMPEMSGRVVAEKVTERRPGVRVLFMSGYTEDQVLLHGIQKTEVAFLSKPFSAGELAARVRRVLDDPVPFSDSTGAEPR